MSVGKIRVQLILTRSFIMALDALVEAGVYMERQTAMRDALRRLFVDYKIPPFYPEAED